MRNTLLVVCGLLLGLGRAFAGTADVASPTTSTVPGAGPTNGDVMYLASLNLVNQYGHSVNLYRDLIADHTVVIHSFFSHCMDSCPVTMIVLKAVQARLVSRLGREVRLISMRSTLPATRPRLTRDTPIRKKDRCFWPDRANKSVRS